MMRRLQFAAGPLLLLLIVTGFYWKLVTKQYTWMDQPDIPYQVLPWYQVEAEAFHRGEFPLWDPNTWGGLPLPGQLQPGATFPLNWILFSLPLANGHINLYFVQLSFILAHVLAAWFCYWLCRDLGCSFAASILGGAAFSLVGVVGWLGWPQHLHGAMWAPLVLLFFLRASRGETPAANAALAGTFLGVAFLSGHHLIPMFIALMMAGLWIAEMVRSRLRALFPAAVFLLFAALTGALQLLPAYEYGVRSVRWVGGSQDPVGWNQAVPYTVHQQFSLLPSGLLSLVLPIAPTDGMFVGLAVLVLAMAGTWAGSARKEARLLTAICGGGALLALGSNSVFHGAAYLLIPLVEKARTPVMGIVIAQFALAVLAAFGLDAMRKRPLAGRWAAVLATLGALIWLGLAMALTLRPQVQREYERWAVFALVAVALAAIHRAGRALPVLVVLLALFEWGTYMGQDYQPRERPAGYLARLEADPDVGEFLRRQPDLARVGLDLNDIQYNFGDWNGIEAYQAYMPALPANLRIADSADVKAQLFSITHYVGKAPERPSQELVFRGKSGMNVYRNPDASPRAWIVHQALHVRPEELVYRLQTSDLRQQTFLTSSAPELEPCGSGEEVRMTGREATRVVVSARFVCRGMLVVSDLWYPGWVATVDGAPAQIHEVDGAIRGVVAGAGAHTIEMRYRPSSVYAGAGLTAVGLLGALALGVRARANNPAPATGTPASAFRS